MFFLCPSLRFYPWKVKGVIINNRRITSSSLDAIYFLVAAKFWFAQVYLLQLGDYSFQFKKVKCLIFFIFIVWKNGSIHWFSLNGPYDICNYKRYNIKELHDKRLCGDIMYHLWNTWYEYIWLLIDDKLKDSSPWTTIKNMNLFSFWLNIIFKTHELLFAPLYSRIKRFFWYSRCQENDNHKKYN